MREHLERIERKLDNHDDDDLYGWDGPIETLEELKEFEVQLANVQFIRKLVNIIKKYTVNPEHCVFTNFGMSPK